MSKAFLLHIDYAATKGAVLRLVLKRQDNGKVFRLFDNSAKPYFYLVPNSDDENVEAKVLKIKTFYQGTEAKPVSIEKVKKKLNGKEIIVLKVICSHPGHVPLIASESKQFGQPFEHQIPFILRYLLDRKLTPMDLVEVKYNGNLVESIAPVNSVELPPLRVLAFDIETYNKNVKSDPKRDPCLMISYATAKRSGVLTYGKKFTEKYVEVLANEKKMLERFCEIVRENHADVIATYNGDEFDLPFLTERAKMLKADFRLGRDKALPKSRKKGIRFASSIGGRIHFDAYPVIAFLNFIGAFKLERMRLQDAALAITGKNLKADIEKKDIHKMWDHGTQKELDYLAHYSINDSIACLAIVQNVLPLQIELAKLTGNLMFDSSRLSAMPLVEPFIMKKSLARGELIPSKPSYSEVSGRDQAPVEGAFVKIPDPGVYEKIAVLDFKSLYPSIIISHNVGSDSYNCQCCTQEGFVSPQGHRFCKKHKSIIADTLEDILDSRFAIQKTMKTMASKESEEYKQLYARQWSLKILANSVYGLTLNPRFRWYTRQGGEATTAWARQFIQEVNKKSEEAKFTVLYNDTDSIFLQYEHEKDVLKFREKINESLPARMELELEDFYPRGIFVAKKGDSKGGARKKYALINREGKIKIRGFELVRRDWSRIARRTQRSVLEILLKEGKVDEAVTLVRNVVAELQSGKVPLDDLVIVTQLRKKPSEYEIKSPEVSAYEKAIKAGLQVPEAVVSYVVTSKGKTISEKAYVREMAKDYDANYYLNHQILPSVLKILSELGITEDDLTTNSKQHTLGKW